LPNLSLYPRKKHEHISPNDPEGLRDLKIKKTLFNVDSEIEELLYHKNIQEEKLKRIDIKAKSILESISSLTTRNKMRENWETITKKGEEGIAKIWETKREFLRSSAHMINLGTVTPFKERTNYKRDETLSYKQALLKNSNEQAFGMRHKFAVNQASRNRRETITDNVRTNIDMDCVENSNYPPSNDWTMVSHSKNDKRSQMTARMKKWH